MFNIAHIGYRVVLKQTADIHRELSRRNDLKSFYLIERVINTGALPDRNTYIFCKTDRNYLLDRIDRFLSEKAFRIFYENKLGAFYENHFKDLNIDIIHAHFGMAGCKLENVKRNTALPLVTTFYGVDASQCLRSPYWLPRFKKLFEYGDCFVVLSEKVKDRLIEKGCPAGKIIVWNCLVDFSCPYTARRYTGNAVKLVTAARFVEKKGYPFLFSVIERLIRKGIKVTLTAVGYGEDKCKMISTVKRLGLEKNVTIIDSTRITDFSTFYNNMLKEHHIFVLTSTISSTGDDEGGPALTLISAQAAGLPVICTPFAGSERSVIDGKTGFIASEDIGVFSERLEYLVCHSELWNDIGKAGSDFVRTEFSKEGQADKMVSIYKEVLDR